MKPACLGSSVGIKLVQNEKSLEEAVKEVGMVVEGINAVEGAYILAQKHSVSTPIINEMYDIIHNGKTPEEATKNLMSRGKKTEF